jgi:salicylate hydroxylase
MAGKYLSTHSLTEQNGEVLSIAPLDPEMTEVYGTPYWLIHRPDYHRLLHEAAVENGCEIRVRSRVISVDESVPSITLKNGETLEADLIVGADGIKSIVRSHSVDQTIAPRAYGECAYRATVPAELLLEEPDLAHFIKEPVASCWIGPGRHLMAYPIQHATKYNLVMVHPGVAVQDRWNEPGNLEEMVGNFADWDPLLVRVLKKIQDCLKWNLADLPLLDTWRSKSGKVVLIGDASHATLPFV